MWGFGEGYVVFPHKAGKNKDDQKLRLKHFEAEPSPTLLHSPLHYKFFSAFTVQKIEYSSSSFTFIKVLNHRVKYFYYVLLNITVSLTFRI